MLNNHAMFNCGFDITLVANASQFHEGCLALVAIPAYDNTIGNINSPTAVSAASLFTYPYQLLNLTTTNRVTLSLPYHGPYPNSYTYSEVMWTVLVIVMAPLQCPVGSTSSSLNLTLYIAPTRTTVHGLRYPETYDFIPLPPTTTSIQLPPKPEPSPRALKPQHWKTRAVPGENAFGNIVSGQEIPLGLTAPVAPDPGYLPGRIYDWVEYAQRPSYFTQSTWTMAEETGALLSAAAVDPTTLADTSTNIGFVMSLFTQWRGEINLHFLFCGSAQHYGRLVVAYTPFAQAPPQTMDDAMHGTYTIWDINGCSTLNFTIPFISNSAWKTIDTSASNWMTSISGYVTVWVVAPLQGPTAAPPSAQVLAFVAAADSFQVRFIQSPIYEFNWQAGDESKDGHDTIETGNVSTAPQAVDTFHYNGGHRALESDLEVFFSMYRYAGVVTDLVLRVPSSGKTDSSFGSIGQIPTQQPLTPFSASSPTSELTYA